MSQYTGNKHNNQKYSEDFSAIIAKCVPSFPVDGASEEFAKAIVASKELTSAQLRRFYNDFKALERRYEVLCSNEDAQEAFNSILPQIKINKAKVSYSRARKTIPASFETWLKKSVDSINSPKSFEDFLLHFESVVGYAYGAGLKDSK